MLNLEFVNVLEAIMENSVTRRSAKSWSVSMVNLTQKTAIVIVLRVGSVRIVPDQYVLQNAKNMAHVSFLENVNAMMVGKACGVMNQFVHQDARNVAFVFLQVIAVVSLDGPGRIVLLHCAPTIVVDMVFARCLELAHANLPGVVKTAVFPIA